MAQRCNCHGHVCGVCRIRPKRQGYRRLEDLEKEIARREEEEELNDLEDEIEARERKEDLKEKAEEEKRQRLNTINLIQIRIK